MIEEKINIGKTDSLKRFKHWQDLSGKKEEIQINNVTNEKKT